MNLKVEFYFRAGFDYCLLILLLVVNLSGCDSDGRRATIAEKKDAIARTKFDTTILKKIATYNSYKDFLLENIDTLLKFRQGEDNCEDFFRNNPTHDLNSVPKFLQHRLDSLWNKIGKECTFEICRNRIISICPRLDGDQEQLRISHELIWNYSKNENYGGCDLYKDSVLNDNLVYRICLIEYYGR